MTIGTVTEKKQPDNKYVEGDEDTLNIEDLNQRISNQLLSKSFDNKYVLADQDILNIDDKGVRFRNYSASEKRKNFIRRADSNVGQLHFNDLLPVLNGIKAETNTENFLQEVFDILMDYIKKSNDRSNKIVDFHQPDQILDAMDFSVPDKPQNLDQILVDCKDTLKYQVKTGHPRFLNQLSQGLDIISMAGEWLAATANTNMFTYEIAPVFLMMENEVLKRMREIIGFSEGDSILAPGGSISNMYGLLCARHRFFPDYKTKGTSAMDQSQIAIYTSAQCHYSIKGACATIGLGTDNCFAVECDERGRMDPKKLEEMIVKHKSEGRKPFFVNCTSGTTVMGAFDPINAIADICQEHNVWMHIDAAWGGGLLMSEKYKPLRFDGVSRADSLTWNPHKLLGTLLQCSTFHLKEKGILIECNKMSADYLFQQDKHYDVSFDTGDKVIQCGRHNDIFKFWLMWRAKGKEGMGAQMDRLMGLARYQVTRMKDLSDKFHLLNEEPECVNVCFWYIPKRFRGMELNKEVQIELGKITAILKQRMMLAGTLMVGYQPLGDTPNFFRSIISNSATREEDVDFMLDEMERLGHDL